ncbi:MAG: tyrosine--tRNA ligase [Candidatus Micrarchaeota archaeon]
MDVETRLQLLKGISQEIVTEDELRQLLETNSKPVAYDGFEPSGLAHLPAGVYRPLLLKDLLKANVKFKLLLADSFAWINEKMNGDLDKIHVVGDYFIEVWKAAGLDTKKVEVIHHMDFFEDKEYWKLVLLVAKNHTEARTKRALQVAGRSEGDVKQTAQLFYPSMQAADVLYLNVDICQLGMDQRKANMLAREVAEKIKRKKPVAVHHRMLFGLDGMSSASASDEVLKMPVSFPTGKDGHLHAKGERGRVIDGNFVNEYDLEINAKMSKSKPNTCIFVHDSTEEIKKKISSAFCPAKVVTGNPILEYNKEIVFRALKDVTIERPVKFGGDVTFASYSEMENAFVEGRLHPMDLKNSTAANLDELIAPIRSHFEKDKTANKLYEQVKSFSVTR